MCKTYPVNCLAMWVCTYSQFLLSLSCGCIHPVLLWHTCILSVLLVVGVYTVTYVGLHIFSCDLLMTWYGAYLDLAYLCLYFR